MVLWAGQQGARFFNDTWTLDLSNFQWTDVSPESRPKARYGSAAVFDSVERSLVQFAGFTAEGTRFQDTQSFLIASRTWKDLTPAGTKPEVRCLHTAAIDADTRRMILYGGQRSGALDDLWSFDLVANDWTEFTPVARPSGRFHAVSFVDRNRRFIVFGGRTNTADVNETWAYDFQSSLWSRVEAANPPSVRHGMMGAWIESDGRFIVFGGSGAQLYNDVWELDTGGPPPRLEITLSESTYVAGDTITATEFRLKNPGFGPTRVHLRVWLTVPTVGEVDLIDIGRDASFYLPGNLDSNLGPLSLITITPAFPPRGSWEFNSRIRDPATGALLSEDRNPFVVQ
jgi:hypothetical protein